jgi:hypothetical protein
MRGLEREGRIMDKFAFVVGKEMFLLPHYP